MIPIECQHFPLLFENHSVDILILQIYYISAALVIIISNGALLNALLKRKSKSRADKVFIILSCSDIGVGLFSVPVTSLPLFLRDWELLCTLSPLLRFFNYIPYSFSWILIIIISLDRVLIITKGHIYKKNVTLKILYGIITLSISIIFVIVVSFLNETSSLREVRHVMLYIQLAIEVCFIIITIAAHIYLFYYVRIKSLIIVKRRHGGADIDKKLMMTVTYTYLCLLLFSFPHFIGVVIRSSWAINDPKAERNVQYWGNILAFSNSYGNAFIILYNNRDKNVERTKDSKSFRSLEFVTTL